MADDFPDFVKFEGFAGQAWYHQHMREKRILRRAREFTPERLFKSGEQGVWYDPSDLSTLFQDSAGTTPVTASGQPVGLMLDKSKGLVRGPELVVNGTFDSGLAGWTQNTPGYWVVSGSRAYHAFSNNYNELKWSFTAATSSYQVTLDMEVVSGTAQCFYQTNPITTTTTISKGVGVHSISFIVTGGLTNVGFSRQVGGEFYIDNISVRELPGNHAAQPTAASRPIYRRGDSRGVVNLLLNSSMALGTEGATPTSWTGRGLVTFKKSGNVAVLTSGGGVPGNSDDARQTLSGLTIGAAHTITFRARKAAASTQTKIIVVMAGVSTSVSGLTDTFQTITLTTTPTGTTHGLFFGGASGLVAEITDVQVNLGPTALPYQRNDSRLGGVATGASTDLHWLETDGVDDGMVTGNIDFTGTDKVSVFAGVRKLSDAATGSVAELGADVGTVNGSFQIRAPATAAANYAFNSRGTLTGFAVSPSTSPAPNSSVLTGAGSISGDVTSVRVNGVVTTVATDQGTGNYGKYPLYLFRRGGTTLPFNGWFYGLAITGRLTTDAETVATERYLAAKSAVVIP